jgi:hypothetical protein
MEKWFDKFHGASYLASIAFRKNKGWIIDEDSQNRNLVISAGLYSIRDYPACGRSSCHYC